MKTHTFNGIKYDIVIDSNFDGLCENPSSRPNLIVVADLKTRAGLESLIHESMHACNYMKSEEAVTQVAYDIARFLWGLGYRLEEK